jgi:hypothetical protein
MSAFERPRGRRMIRPGGRALGCGEGKFMRETKPCTKREDCVGMLIKRKYLGGRCDTRHIDSESGPMSTFRGP